MTVMLVLSILIVTADGGANDDDKGIEGGVRPPLLSPVAPALADSKPAPPLEKGMPVALGGKKVFVVGMPKSGTSSIQSYFSCGGGFARRPYRVKR